MPHIMSGPYHYRSSVARPLFSVPSPTTAPHSLSEHAKKGKFRLLPCQCSSVRPTRYELPLVEIAQYRGLLFRGKL